MFFTPSNCVRYPIPYLCLPIPCQDYSRILKATDLVHAMSKYIKLHRTSPSPTTHADPAVSKLQLTQTVQNGPVLILQSDQLGGSDPTTHQSGYCNSAGCQISYSKGSLPKTTVPTPPPPPQPPQSPQPS